MTSSQGARPGPSASGLALSQSPLLSSVVASALAIAAAALSDAWALRWSQLAGSGPLSTSFMGIWGLMTQRFVARYPEVLGLLLLAGLARGLEHRWWARWRLAFWLLLGLLLSASLYWRLIAYERFAGYWPFIAASLALALVWSANHCLPGRLATLRFVRRLAVGSALLVAALAAHGHGRYFVGYYPTLHGALLGVVALSLQGGLSGLFDAFSGASSRWLHGALLGSFVVAVAVALGPLASKPPRAVLLYARTYSTLLQPEGEQASPLASRAPRSGASCDALLAPMSPDEAAGVFRKHSGLEGLPAEFRLQDRNLLLVLIEALRTDATSIGGTRGETPNLRRLEEMGAFAFTQARSPSTSTLQSVASLMTMRLPFDVPLSLGVEANWHGSLSRDVRVLAEELAANGYFTFHWVHGGVRGCCGMSLSRGFREDYFVGEPLSIKEGGQLKIDRVLARHASESIRQRHQSGQPFFGWVFFLSPHNPYEQRVPGKLTLHQVYRGDVADADEQFGRLLDSLIAEHAMDDTVVVVAGDHGEAFGEHGSSFHGTGVNAELARVPLWLWLPGVRGRRLDDPTSVAYVLPWLLQRSEATRASTTSTLAESIAPMMRATRGAIPVELYKAAGLPHSVSLTDEQQTAIFHFRSGLTERYDREQDPEEHHDLNLAGGRSEAAISERLAGYLDYRKCIIERRQHKATR